MRKFYSQQEVQYIYFFNIFIYFFNEDKCVEVGVNDKIRQKKTKNMISSPPSPTDNNLLGNWSAYLVDIDGKQKKFP